MRIFTTKALAARLEMPLNWILEINRHAPDLYQPFVRRRNGKARTIDRPTGALLQLQRRVCRRLLRDYNFLDCVHAGVRNRSIFTAVAPHVRRQTVITCDIRDFYPGLSASSVYNVWLREVGLGRDVARLLTSLTTRGGGVPQGAPTSMALANLVMAPADLEILLQLSLIDPGLRYTRYVDDLIISGNIKDPAQIFQIVAAAVRRVQLRLHRKETKRRVMRASGLQTALGLNLNNRIAIPRSRRAAIRAAVAAYVLFRRGRYDVLMGRVAFIARSYGETAKRLIAGLTRVADRAANARSTRRGFSAGQRRPASAVIEACSASAKSSTIVSLGTFSPRSMKPM